MSERNCIVQRITFARGDVQLAFHGTFVQQSVLPIEILHFFRKSFRGVMLSIDQLCVQVILNVTRREGIDIV